MNTTVLLSERSKAKGRKTMKFTFAPESKPLDGYTIKRAIHRGGFGEVYYALSDAGKEVALKLIQQNMDIELRGVSQCLNLKHPNLVTIFDIRTDGDGDHWVVMEYVSGKGLDKVLADHPHGLPMDEVEHWLKGIADGISFLHDRGIVHRDLKPANIYTESRLVKVGDVGLSKFIAPSRRSAHTQSVGTVYYMAPEVAHGRYGREVDVYALGIILFEMLTGHVPFDGETTGEILMKHLSEKPDLSKIPERLRPVLAGALEKDPLKRTASVSELKDDFLRAVRGADVALRIPDESFVVNEPRNAAGLGGPNGTCERPVRVAVYQNANGRDRSHPQAVPVSHHNGPGRADAKGDVSQPTLWYRDSRFWWWTVAVLVLSAVLAPNVLLVLLAFGAYGALAYGIYRIATAVVSPTSVPAIAPAAEMKSPPASVRGRSPGYARIFLTPDTRRTIPLRNRMTELTSSLTMAAVCTAVVTLGLSFSTSFLPDPGTIGLFTAATLLSSWAILAFGKLSEGRGADVMPRRLMNLLLGVLAGGAAFWCDQLLMVDIPLTPSFNTLHSASQRFGSFELVDRAQQPTLAGYMVFFGALFGLRRWWWHSDAFRPKRLRIASLLLTVSLAYLVSLVWAFPPLWAMTWAAAISSVVQLSAVWVPPQERAQYLGGPSNV